MNNVADIVSATGLTVTVPHDGARGAVVDGIDLTLRAGEFLGLVGESGSGKSMTARALVRLLPRGAQASGAVEICGSDVIRLKSRELRNLRASRVAMIFQDPRAHIDPLWTVQEHIAEALRLIGVKSRASVRSRCSELLRSVGIVDPERCMASYPDQLSGGMLQRVMIAGALASEPDVLIADEPTTALDVTTQVEIMAILAGLREERNLAMIFITHDLELAATLCDRVMVIYAGMVVEEGPCGDVFKRCLHPYTWGLLNARPLLDRPVRRLAVIPGHPASGLDAPAGCRFAPRCAWALDSCLNGRPPLTEVDQGRRSACIRVDDLRDELRSD
jgi:oligopeptide/dipeptide ABC transporter ATP-binding protein